MMEKGYFIVGRGWQNEGIFSDNKTEPFNRYKAWLYLLEEAAYQKRTKRIDGALYSIERGENVQSLRFLGAAWNWSKDRVAKFLYELEAENWITIVKAIPISKDKEKTCYRRRINKIIINNYNEMQVNPMGRSFNVKDNVTPPLKTVTLNQFDKTETRETTELINNNGYWGAITQDANCTLLSLFPECSDKDDFINHIPPTWRDYAFSRDECHTKIEDDIANFWEYYVGKNSDVERMNWFSVWQKWMDQYFRNKPYQKSG